MKKPILITLIISLLQVCCEKDFSDHWSNTIPVNMQDGINVGSLEEVDIDYKMISKAVGRIQQGKYKEVHSMLIYKDNRLVLEEYFQGYKFKYDAHKYHGEFIEWDETTPHHIMSCSKSFTSACIGIAIDLGYIESVDQSIFDYLPKHQHFKTDEKEYITIEHLLTMTSGLTWNEWGASHGTSANDIDMLYLDCDDPVSCVLERELLAVPGDKFTYNGGGMVILGEILKNATNMNLDEFSMSYIFGPLDIDFTLWTQYENGMIDAAGSLRLSSREMMKFGATYLHDGVWNGQRILSSNWILKSSTIYRNNSGINIPSEDSGKNGYGYSWWISEISHNGRKIKMYRAGGWGGQAIMVFPELNMVVVFTGGNYGNSSSLFEIIKRFVLPAIQ